MTLRIELLTVLGAAVPPPAEGAPSPAQPPVAPTIPHETHLHGDTRRDDYHWLREKEDPAVRAYLEAENAYTDAVMQPTTALQETLYREMVGRIQ